MTGLRPRGVTAALRALYPNADIRTRTPARLPDLPPAPPGLTVYLPARLARYLGIGHDNRRAANYLGWHMRTPVAITRWDGVNSTDPGAYADFTVAPDDTALAIWADPGGTYGVPSYSTVEEVLGPFPATRPVRQMIQIALDASLRPHLDLAPSPRGPRYRLLLWGTDPATLSGCIDVSEETGQYREAWLMWRDPAVHARYGWGEEKHYGRTQAAEVRRQLENARGLHRDLEAGVRW